MRRGRKHSNQHETPSATDIKSCWIHSQTSSHTQLQRCHEQRLYEPHESICMHFKASYQQCTLGQQMYLFFFRLPGWDSKEAIFQTATAPSALIKLVFKTVCRMYWAALAKVSAKLSKAAHQSQRNVNDT